jgi:viroplasmin and RNaseH domain-containing protein
MFKKKEDAEAFMEQVSQVTPKPNQNGILETDGCIYEKEIKLVDGWYKILIPLDY